MSLRHSLLTVVFLWSPLQALYAQSTAPGLLDSLEEGVSLYNKNNLEAASEKFYEVIQQSPSTEPARHKADFYLAKTLYHLGYETSAFLRFREIALFGSTHGYYRASIKFMLALSDKIPEEYFLPVFFLYPAQDFPEKERFAAYFELGRASYQKGYFEYASAFFEVALLGKSTPEVRLHYAKSLLAQGKTQEGREELRALVEALSTQPKSPTRTLALFALAESYYQSGLFREAGQSFGQVSKESELWLEATVAKSFAQYQSNEFNAALGSVFSFQAPIFGDGSYPEGSLLSSYLYFSACHYQEAAQSLENTQEQIETLSNFLGSLSSLSEKSFFALLAPNAEIEPSLRWVLTFLADEKLRAQSIYLSTIEGESRRLQAKPFGEALQTLLVSGLRQEKERALQDRAKERQAALAALQARLSSLAKQATLLEAALRLNTPEDRPKEKLLFSTTGSRKWAFDREYWKDELGSFQGNLRVACYQKEHSSQAEIPPALTFLPWR